MSSDPWLGKLLLQLFLILVIGWCVGVKTAVSAVFPSVNRQDDDDDTDSRRLYIAKNSGRIVAAMDWMLSAAIIVSAVISHVWFSPVWAKLFASVFESMIPAGVNNLAAVVNVISGSLIVTAFGILIPKSVVSRHAKQTLMKYFGIIKVLTMLLTPLTCVLASFTRFCLSVFGIKTQKAAEQVTEEEIRSMVDIGSEHGTIEETEKEMIENIFEFNNHTAEDVMVHRTAVDCIWIQDDRDTVLRTILETGRSRFPVYNDDMDDIVGILNTRDFLLDGHSANPRPLKNLLREAYFVPETVQADVLFRNMQKNKIQMSVVVDEYGGMAGIVTMEDLLEEIVGNIYDETDKQTPAEITKIGDNHWKISGSTSLEDISDVLDVKLPLDEEYDTLSGLVFDQFTTIPEDGSHPEINVFGLHIKVEKIFEHHVETAIVSINPQEKDEEQEEK